MWTGRSTLRVLRYGRAAALVALAVGVNLLLLRLIDRPSVPFLFLAVLCASWLDGWGPGLLATALAGLADDYFFTAPIGSIDFNATNVVRLLVFLAVSLLTSYLTVRLKEAVAERDRLLVREREAREAAEKANAMKDRFLAVTSHELRNPLSAIVMWGDLLGTMEASKEVREGIEAIRRSAGAQQRLIEDLLDVARLDAHKLRLEMERVDMRALVREAVCAARPGAAAKGIELRLEEECAGELAVMGDWARLQQVVGNLLGNAVKFTPAGGWIRVEVGRHDGWAVVRVADSGRGIDAEHLGRVFDRFWQVGETRKSAGDGLGLGLAIVRDLVKLHGGEIRAESAGVGQGATFVVELPVGEGAGEAGEAAGEHAEPAGAERA
jgi:signal transduction histidine kinase